MAKARSPAYPAIGLKEAIEAAGRIYKADYQNAIPREVAAKHMGYNGLNGKSLGALSALVKYGLLEGRGDETKVSARAVTIIAHGPGAPERVEALKAAMTAPELFVDLDLRFQGGKASDEAIRAYLLTNKFIPAAADNVIRSYRDTKALLTSESEAYNAKNHEPKEQPKMEEQLSERATHILDASQTAVEYPIQEVFNLPEGTVTITFPKRLSADSYQDLEDQLSLILRRVKRQAGKKNEGAN